MGRGWGGSSAATATWFAFLACFASKNGPRSPAPGLPGLFERFRRIDRAHDGTDGDSGPGLAITRAIVQAYGGSIAVRSAPDPGTAFTVTLPVPLPAGPAAAPSPPPRELTPRPHRPSIGPGT